MPPKKDVSSNGAQFLQPGYLLAAKSSELSMRFRGCFEYLRGMAQAEADELPPGLENIASQLLHDTLCRSKHPAVRVLAAQCAVELLRIYAPMPPYTPDQQKRVFNLIIEVLPWLRKGGSAMSSGAAVGGDTEETLFEGACHVLESLEEVRSVCIVAELANNAFAEHADDADEQVVRLLETLFGTMT